MTCDGCGLIFSSPSSLPHLSDRFSIHFEKIGDVLLEGKTEIEAYKKYLKMLASRSGDISNLLLIAEPGHYFAALAKDFGFTILRHLSVVEFENGVDLPKAVDAVVIIYQLEKAHALEKVLDRAYETLRPGGELFLVSLSLDSRSARFFSQAWTGWHPEN